MSEQKKENHGLPGSEPLLVVSRAPFGNTVPASVQPRRERKTLPLWTIRTTLRPLDLAGNFAVSRYSRSGQRPPLKVRKSHWRPSQDRMSKRST